MLVMPRIEIEFEFDMVFWSSVLAYVWHRMLFFFFFFFFFVVVVFFPLGFTFNTLHDLLKVIDL